eukprot:6981736-Ditylum_brightwellii.AAC.1
MLLQKAWKEVFNLLPENEQGNRNTLAFSLALKAGKSHKEKLRLLTEDVDTVFLVADDKKNIVGELVLCLTGTDIAALACPAQNGQ